MGSFRCVDVAKGNLSAHIAYHIGREGNLYIFYALKVSKVDDRRVSRSRLTTEYVAGDRSVQTRGRFIVPTPPLSPHTAGVGRVCTRGFQVAYAALKVALSLCAAPVGRRVRRGRSADHDHRPVRARTQPGDVGKAHTASTP